jgi:hypothetical protein
MARWSKFFTNTDVIWDDFRRNCIFSDIVAHAVKFEKLQLEVDDPLELLQLARQQGCLFLTLHHHYAYHLPMVLGRLGISISELTVDPGLSPLRRLLLHYPTYFSKFEAHFNGGKFLFLNPHANNYRQMRTALRDLQQGVSLISVHDFESPYAAAERVAVRNQFMCVQAPSGVIPSCVRQHIPIIYGYLTMTDSLGFRLHLRSQNLSPTENNVEKVFDFYSRQVELTISEHPYLFDHWHLSAQD